MAKITSYVSDSSLSTTDKILGTDATDGSTKNFPLGALATFVESQTAYTAGAGINITNRVISATGGSSVTIEEFIGTNDADIICEPNLEPVVFSAVGTNPNNDSLSYNLSNLSIGNSTVQNSSSNTIILKLSVSCFVRALANNTEITYSIQTSSDGTTWTTIRSATREKTTQSRHADSFFEYITLPASEYIRVAVSSSTGDIRLEQGSKFEFIVK